MEIVQKTKEKFCYVSKSRKVYEEDVKEFKNSKEYVLPDAKNIIVVDNERIKVGEAYFDPNVLLVTREDKTPLISIVDMIEKCVEKIEKKRQKEFCENIVLSGGSSLFEGMGVRLKEELKKRFKNKNDKKEVKIRTHHKRDRLPWVGASIETSLSTFYNRWITANDYEEVGLSIIHRKCSNTCNMVLQKSNLVWSKDTHKFFNEKFRKFVVFLIMCCNSKDSSIYSLPFDVLFVIISFLYARFEGQKLEDLLYLQAIKKDCDTWNGLLTINRKTKTTKKHLRWGILSLPNIKDFEKFF